MKYVEKYLCDDAHYSHMISFEQQEGDAIVMPNFWCFSSRFAAQRYVRYITVFCGNRNVRAKTDYSVTEVSVTRYTDANNKHLGWYYRHFPVDRTDDLTAATL